VKKFISTFLLAGLLATGLPAQGLSDQRITVVAANSATTISVTNRAGLTSLLNQNPVATRLTCTGFTKSRPTTKDKSTALAKAKSFCNAAKAQRSSLTTVTTTAVTKVAKDIGKVSLALVIPSYPQTALGFSNLPVDWVARAATSKVLERFDNNRPSNVAINYVISDNVPATSANRERALIADATRLWSDTFTKSFTVVLFSEKDAEWADQKLAELGGDLPGGVSGYLSRPGATDQCILGFASIDKKGDPIYYNCLHSSGRRYSVADHTAIHEHFHMVQNSIYKQNTLMPLWVNEGAPTFFGFALGFGRGDRNGRFAERFFLTSPAFDPNETGSLDASRFARFATTATDQEIVDVYLKLEGDPANRDGYNQYGLGAIAAQALVAVSGVDAYLEFLRKTQTRDWKVAFSEAYGLSTQQFYQSLAPYIRALGKKYLQ
jgi:hypothetical protein